MRSAPSYTGATRDSATQRAVPRAIFDRVPLPGELAQAIGAALDAEGRESDVLVLAALRGHTRRALEAWLEGAMTTAQTVRALRIACDPGVRLVR
jgi:hypothetical protein